MIKTFKILYAFLTLFSAAKSWAYPDFIGYGYSTCIVCHYNSQGGGPLTDYGRALFSQEIAARAFVSPKISDEQLSDQSGFIPGKELPYWFRPSLKYRGLYYNQNVTANAQIKKWIDMQRDINLVFPFDTKQKTIFTVTYGLLNEEKDYYHKGSKTNIVSREHYFRFYPIKQLSLAIGLMDKVYGLRTADHTSYSRGSLGLGQNDQVHGIVAEWMSAKWNWAIHFFQGNLLQDSAYRQKGYSTLFDYDIGAKHRLGTSFISFETDFLKAQRFAVHDRWGFPNSIGSSIIAEIGVKQDTVPGTDTTTGTYGLIQSTIRIKRGYSFVTTIERLQNDSRPSSTDNQKWSLGILAFPVQRVEVRAGVVQTKGFSSETAQNDNWGLQGQLHVSW